MEYRDSDGQWARLSNNISIPEVTTIPLPSAAWICARKAQYDMTTVGPETTMNMQTGAKPRLTREEIYYATTKLSTLYSA